MSFEHSFKMECIKDAPCYNCLRESRLSQLQADQERLTIKYEGYLQKLRDDWTADSEERQAFIDKLQAESARYRDKLEYIRNEIKVCGAKTGLSRIIDTICRLALSGEGGTK